MTRSAPDVPVLKNEGSRPLPHGWHWVRLGEVCTFEYGSSLPERDRRNGTVPVFGSNGVVGAHDRAISEGPAIIIGRKGSIGEANYSKYPCWPIDTTYYIDATKTSCHLDWLYWAIKFLRLDLLNKATGVPGLNREDAYAQWVPLPPLAEQRRIAAILSEQMSAVEQARKALQEELDTIDKLSAALLHRAFAGGI